MFWNYLDSSKENTISAGNNPINRPRVLSLEEIQKEELSKRQPAKPLKEEDTKNDWGMQQERAEVNFDKVLVEESVKKEQVRAQFRRDEEIAKRLREEELIRQEEEILEQVLKASLHEFNNQQSETEQIADTLLYHQPGGKKRRRGKAAAPTGGMVWVAKPNSSNC